MTIREFKQIGTDGRTALSFGPRCDPPVDELTRMTVFHIRMDDGVPLVLARKQITQLAAWFRSCHVPLELKGPETSVTLRKHPSGYVVVTLAWNGSGPARSVALCREDARATELWLTKIDRDGWVGWKSQPLAVVPTQRTGRT
jgi:hypothetical protein